MFELHPQLEADCFWLGDFPLSRLLLMNDSRYPWMILVPRQKGITEQFELSENDQLQLMVESSVIAKMLKILFRGDKMNVAALGNVVPQLHIHHVVRFKNDETWPAPIWGKGSAIAYKNDEAEVIISTMVAALAAYKIKTPKQIETELESKFNTLNFSVNTIYSAING